MKPSNPAHSAGRWLRTIQPLLCVGSLFIAISPVFSSLPGIPGLFFDNLGHFRLAGLFAAAIAALAGLRRPFVLRSAALLAIVHAAPILAYGMSFSPESAAPDATLKIYYANIEMTSAWRGRRSDILLRDIRRRDPDVVLFTEYDTTGFAFFDTALAAYPHKLYQVRDDCFGLALYSKRPFRDRWLGPYDDWGLPAIFVCLDSPLIEVVLVHPLPPKTENQRLNRDTVFASLERKCRAWDVPRIVVGDFNATERNAGFQKLLAAGLNDSREGHGWSPSWPVLKHGHRAWWKALAALPFAIPIDHVLVSRHFRVAQRATGPSFGSDHLPLFVAMTLEDRIIYSSHDE
jgi:endonuclease/exonuclease/phosphatase (EEP) superfamily protein YafD